MFVLRCCYYKCIINRSKLQIFCNLFNKKKLLKFKQKPQTLDKYKGLRLKKKFYFLLFFF